MGISRFNAALSFALSGSFVLTPLALLPLFSAVFVIPKLFVVVLATAVCAWTFLRRDVPGTRADVPLAVFCVSVAVSVALSTDVRWSLFGRHYDVLFSSLGLAGCVAGFYSGAALAREKKFHEAVTWAVCASVLVSFVSLFQAAGFMPFGSTRWATDSRIGATMGNPVSLGAYFAWVLPLALHMASQKNLHTRKIGSAAVTAGSLALFYSGSRGALLGALSAAAVYGWPIFGKAFKFSAVRPAKKWGFAALFAAAALALSLGLRSSNQYLGSDSARLDLWRIAVEMFSDQPIFGAGPGTYSIFFTRLESEATARIYTGNGGQDHAHNDWLEILATVGLAGFCCYIWLHAAAFKGAVNAVRAGPDGLTRALAASVVGLFVQAKTNSPSFAVAWLGAVSLGGILLDRSGRQGFRRRLPALLFFPAAAYFLFFAGARVAADRLNFMGHVARQESRPRDAANYYEKAISMNPDMDKYRYDLANLLWDISGGAVLGKAEGSQVLLLRRAAEAAAEGLLLHPRSINLHRLLGLAELKRYQWAGEDRLAAAQEALERALDAGPFFEKTLKDLIAVARLKGDVERVKQLESRVKRIGGKVWHERR